MFSPEQAQNMQLGHRYELCPGAKSLAGSGLDVWSLTRAGSEPFCWDSNY